MKTENRLFTFSKFTKPALVIAFLIIFYGCPPSPPELDAFSIIPYETSADTRWITSNDEYHSVEINVYPTEAKADSPHSMTVNDPSNQKVNVENLKGLTEYHYQIDLLRSHAWPFFQRS
jgi:hypothetical protein